MLTSYRLTDAGARRVTLAATFCAPLLHDVFAPGPLPAEWPITAGVFAPPRSASGRALS